MPPRRTTRASTRAAEAAVATPAPDAEPKDPDGDPAFIALPRTLQRRIDAAFDRTARRGEKPSGTEGPPPRKRRRLGGGASSSAYGEENAANGNMAMDTGGGFFVEDAPGGLVPEDIAPGGFLPEDMLAGGFLPEDSGGGFLMEEDSTSAPGGFLPESRSISPPPSHADSILSASPASLALSAIPAALVRLGLPPDDPDVLRVFENAASGWTAGPDVSARTVDDVDEAIEKGVSRKDWRAVCAVLLEGANIDDSPDEDQENTGHHKAHRVGDEDEDDGSDIYIDSNDDEDKGEEEDAILIQSDPSDDEYGAGPSSKVRGVAKGKRSRQRRGATDSADDAELSLSTAQEAEVRRSFGLFFDAVHARGPIAGAHVDAPPIDPRPLEVRRLGIRELDAAAKLLKEKLTADDLVEMLALFSTTPDKTVGLDEFSKMMRTAGLV